MTSKKSLSSNNSIEFDELLTYMGDLGRYQKVIILLIGMSCFMGALYNVSIVFIAANPNHWCRVPALDGLGLNEEEMKNLSIPLEPGDTAGELSSCYMYNHSYKNWREIVLSSTAPSSASTPSSSSPPSVSGDADGGGGDEGRLWKEELIRLSEENASLVPCQDGWLYDRSQYSSSIVMEWDLVCDREWLRVSPPSAYMAGLMVGNALSGTLGDRFGRKKVFCAELFLGFVFTVVKALVPNITMFIAFHFCVALFTAVIYTVGFTQAMEMVGPGGREMAGMVTMYTWVGGYVLVAGVAYAIRDHFWLQMALAAPLVLQAVDVFLLSESPRWLYCKGRKTEAERIIRKMAKVNRVTLPETLDVVIKEEKSGNFLDMFRTRQMLIRTLVVLVAWGAINFVYWGISYNSSSLGGNDYINFMIMGAVELPAYLVGHVAIAKCGRRVPFASFTGISGLLLLATLVVPYKGMAATVMVMLGKFTITAAFGIVFVYTVELYPTSIRTLSLGICSSFSRITGVLAPYVVLLSNAHQALPTIIYAILPLVAAFLSLFLPETLGTNLPQSIKEAENLGKSSNQCVGLLPCVWSTGSTISSSNSDKKCHIDENDNSCETDQLSKDL